jgi:hypothetical protein
MKEAEALMREAGGLAPTTDYVEFNQRLLPVFLLGRQRWDDAEEHARRLARGKWAATRAMGHTLVGHAQLGRGRIAEARASLALAEAEVESLPASAAGIGVGRGHVKPWVDVLRGELLLRDGDRAEGARLLKANAQALRALPGPDAWIQALFRLETMARVARDAGEWDLAEHMAREMLDHDAAYAGSHLAQALVLDQRGDRAGAEAAHGAAARYWRDADPDLAERRLLRDASGTGDGRVPVGN